MVAAQLDLIFFVNFEINETQTRLTIITANETTIRIPHARM